MSRIRSHGNNDTELALAKVADAHPSSQQVNVGGREF